MTVYIVRSGVLTVTLVLGSILCLWLLGSEALAQQVQIKVDSNSAQDPFGRNDSYNIHDVNAYGKYSLLFMIARHFILRLMSPYNLQCVVHACQLDT